MQLTRCLDLLTAQDYPHDCFEVIVVDDGSEMPPDAIVASFCDRLTVRLLTQSHAGPSAARNTGTEQARGKYLAFTDDDCAPAPSWLSALAAGFATAPDCAIGGQTLNALPGNPYSTASQLIIDHVYSWYNANPCQARFFATNNLAVSTQRFHGLGGFRADLFPFASEDRDFCDRWLRRGYRMVYVPEAVIYHAHALTLRTFWRQHWSYGRGAFRFRRPGTGRGQDNSRLESLSFYLKLLCCPFSRAELYRAPLLAVLLLISQMASAVGFCWERGNQASQMTRI